MRRFGDEASMKGKGSSGYAQGYQTSLILTRLGEMKWWCYVDGCHQLPFYIEGWLAAAMNSKYRVCGAKWNFIVVREIAMTSLLILKIRANLAYVNSERSIGPIEAYAIVLLLLLLFLFLFYFLQPWQSWRKSKSSQSSDHDLTLNIPNWVAIGDR